MNPADIAPFAVAITLILTTGAVILLRPISRRLGDLLEAMAKERREPPRRVSDDTHRMVDLLEAMNARMERLEERQDFTDSLLGSGREGKALPRARAESRDAAV